MIIRDTNRMTEKALLQKVKENLIANTMEGDAIYYYFVREYDIEYIIDNNISIEISNKELRIRFSHGLSEVITYIETLYMFLILTVENGEVINSKLLDQTEI